jgi:hypothetical protein
VCSFLFPPQDTQNQQIFRKREKTYMPRNETQSLLQHHHQNRSDSGFSMNSTPSHHQQENNSNTSEPHQLYDSQQQPQQDQQHQLDFPCSSLFYRWYNWVFGEFLLNSDSKILRARKLTLFLFGQFALVVLISAILMIVEAHKEPIKEKSDIMIAAASLLIYFALGVSFPCNICKNKYNDAPEAFLEYVFWATSILCLIGTILLSFFPTILVHFSFVTLSIICELPSRYYLLSFIVLSSLFIGLRDSFSMWKVADAYGGTGPERFGFTGLTYVTFEFGVAWILIGVQNHKPRI